MCVKDTKRAESKHPTKSEAFPERILGDLCVVPSPPYTHTQHLQAIFFNPSPSPSPHTHTRTHVKEHKNKDATKSEVFLGSMLMLRIHRNLQRNAKMRQIHANIKDAHNAEGPQELNAE